MQTKISQFIQESEEEIQHTERRVKGVKDLTVHEVYMVVLAELRRNLRRFKRTFDIPLDKDELYVIALENKHFNDPKKWDSLIALIDADVIMTIEDLRNYSIVNIL